MTCGLRRKQAFEGLIITKLIHTKKLLFGVLLELIPSKEGAWWVDVYTVGVHYRREACFFCSLRTLNVDEHFKLSMKTLKKSEKKSIML